MKLCILGGGGFRTPYVYQALLRDTGSPRVDQVALYDVDQDRLDTMVAILTELAEGFPEAPELVPTTDLRRAVEGSDFVFAALRVGGLEGRRCDEHVALDLSVLGQETTGPGGLAYAIRTVPVMVEAAQAIKELAPDAYVMNFTNPAGIITEAMQTVLGDRVLGICDTPSGLGRRVAGLLGLDHNRIQMDYVGLNHLGWMRRVLYDGRDVLPELMADDALLSAMEEGHVFGTDWIRTLGAVPNEYLYYYYFNRDAVRTILDSGKTRGDFLAESQTDFYTRAAAAGHGVADLWRTTVERRSASYMAEAKGGTQDAPTHVKEREADPAHQGYAGVALGVMAAISRNERQTMILNVRNGGTIKGLPDDAVVEVPTLVDANGVHPLTTEQPNLHQIGLMSQVKDVERHTIAAALTGSRSEAVAAFALHPLVDSVTVARSLVSGYIDRIPEVAAVLVKVRITVSPDRDTAGEAAAECVLALLGASPGRVLGVATGSSPQPLYRALTASGTPLADVRAFALDEYIGLPPGHPQSYRAIVDRDVTRPLGLDPRLVAVPDARSHDHEAAVAAYDAAIAAAGGVDVQIVGIGANGHIGFNEPGSARDSRTRVVALAASTRAANARFFDRPEDVPREAITQGVGTILEARHIVLVASGEGKAEAVRAAVAGPVTRDSPASFLRDHPSVALFLDEAAASLLERSAPADSEPAAPAPVPALSPRAR